MKEIHSLQYNTIIEAKFWHNLDDLALSFFDFLGGIRLPGSLFCADPNHISRQYLMNR